MTPRLYHWASCSTCRQAREELAGSGRRVELRDFFAEPLSSTELAGLAELAGGVRRIFSFNSPSFRKLGRTAESFADEELMELIAAEPRFLRRPLLVNERAVVIGVAAIRAADTPRDPG